jgi:hypothetical protein
MTVTNLPPNSPGSSTARGSWLKYFLTITGMLFCIGGLFRIELDGVQKTLDGVQKAQTVQFEQVASVSRKIDTVSDNLSKKMDAANDALSKKMDAGNDALSKKIDESVRRVDNRIGALEKTLAETPLGSRRYAMLQQRFEAQGTALQQRFEQQGDALQKRIEAMVERLTKPAVAPPSDPTVGTAPALAFNDDEKAQIRHSLRLDGPPSKAQPKYLVGETVTDAKPIPERLVHKLPKLTGFRVATDPNTGSALFVDANNRIVALVPKAGSMN